MRLQDFYHADTVREEPIGTTLDVSRVHGESKPTCHRKYKIGNPYLDNHTMNFMIAT